MQTVSDCPDNFRQLHIVAEMFVPVGSVRISHLNLTCGYMIMACHPVKGNGEDVQMETFLRRYLNFYTTEIMHKKQHFSFSEQSKKLQVYEKTRRGRPCS